MEAPGGSEDEDDDGVEEEEEEWRLEAEEAQVPEEREVSGDQWNRGLHSQRREYDGGGDRQHLQGKHPRHVSPEKLSV